MGGELLYMLLKLRHADLLYLRLNLMQFNFGQGSCRPLFLGCAFRADRADTDNIYVIWSVSVKDVHRTLHIHKSISPISVTSSRENKMVQKANYTELLSLNHILRVRLNFFLP